MSTDRSASDRLLQFPCSFPIKVMGRDSPDFRDSVVGVVERFVGALDEGAVRTAPSRKGNFVSVTVTINAQSQQQLDDIYRALTTRKDVLVSL